MRIEINVSLLAYLFDDSGVAGVDSGADFLPEGIGFGFPSGELGGSRRVVVVKLANICALIQSFENALHGGHFDFTA